MIPKEDLLAIKTRSDLIEIAEKNNVKVDKRIKFLTYEKELKMLQTQLVTLQRWITQKNMRVAVVFEGCDASGKGGAIKRFIEHLNPRTSRVVALNKPTKTEKGQWYFQRYIKELPNPGEIVFFDRSWYNRAVVEPVNGFCTNEEYATFMQQVPEFEHMIYESNIHIIKFWFSVSKEEQKKRFDARLNNPLKLWKFSPVDMKGQELWDKYAYYKEEMFSKSHTQFSPWTVVKTNDKKEARLESIRYVLSQFEYEGKDSSEVTLLPDLEVIQRYYRSNKQLNF